MQRFFSFRPALIVIVSLTAAALMGARAAAEEVEFRASGEFSIFSVENHFGTVIVSGTSEPGGDFEGTLVERYYGNLGKIGNVHKIEGAGVFDYGDGHTLTIKYELRFDAATNLDTGPFVITGGTGVFAGATGGGILVADHALEGKFDLVGTISW